MLTSNLKFTNKNSSQTQNLILLLIALFFLSQSANIVRWTETPVEVLGFWRLLLVSIILMPFALSHLSEIRSSAQYPASTLNTSKKIAFNKNLKITFLSGFFLFLHFWTFFYAAHNTKIANTMIIFSTNPLFTALFTWLLFKEKLSLKITYAYLFAVFGLFMLFAESFDLSIKQIGSPLFYGDLSALFSALFYSIYMLTGRDARKAFPNTLYSFFINLIAGALFGILLLFKKIDFFHYPLKTWAGILMLSFGPSLMGHAILTYLLKHLNITLISCSKLIEPIMSAIVAFLLFQEPTSQSTYWAFLFTCISVLIMFWPNSKSNH